MAQLRAQLSRLTDRTRLRRLKDTLLSKGAWQTCAMLRSPTSGSTTWTREGEVSSRRTITSPTCRIGMVTESGWEMASDGAVTPSLNLSWSTQKPAATPKALCMRSRRLRRAETPGHRNHHGTERSHSFAIQAGR